MFALEVIQKVAEQKSEATSDQPRIKNEIERKNCLCLKKSPVMKI